MKFEFEMGAPHRELAYRRWWRHWEKLPETTAVIRDGEVAVAALRLFARVGEFRDERFDVVGVGGVYVAANRRGEGVGTLLLTETVRGFRERLEVDFLALYSRDRSLYERVGFRKVFRPRGGDEWLWLAPVKQRAAPKGEWKLIPEWHF